MNTAENSYPVEPKVCLVTGGAGMLGQAIVSQLLVKVATVRIIDIDPARNDRAEVIAGDIRDAAAGKRAFYVR